MAPVRTFLYPFIVLAMTTSAAAQERMIHKEIVVDVPPATAFKAWSTPEGLQSFFAPEAVVEARPMGAFAIHFNPYAAAGQKGGDDLRVLAIQPDRMISFTWNAPPSFPEIRPQRTVVVVRTEPAGDGKTRVSISHLAWGTGGQWDEVFKYFENAWGYVLSSYEKSLKDGPRDWKPSLDKLKAQTPR